VSTDQHAGHGAGEEHGGEISSCDDVLSHVFEFLDRETDDARRAVIAEHLEDCSPCLRQFGIEQEFKALVRRRCGGDPPPVGLRDRIKLQLTTVSFEEDGTQVRVERASYESVTTTESGQPRGERP
jgi:mycothiol system anti-sigma-R factor